MVAEAKQKFDERKVFWSPLYRWKHRKDIKASRESVQKEIANIYSDEVKAFGPGGYRGDGTFLGKVFDRSIRRNNYYGIPDCDIVARDYSPQENDNLALVFEKRYGTQRDFVDKHGYKFFTKARNRLREELFFHGKFDFSPYHEHVITTPQGDVIDAYGHAHPHKGPHDHVGSPVAPFNDWFENMQHKYHGEDGRIPGVDKAKRSQVRKEISDFFHQMNQKYGSHNKDPQSTKAQQLEREFEDFFSDLRNRYSSTSRDNDLDPRVDIKRHGYQGQGPLSLEDIQKGYLSEDGLTHRIAVDKAKTAQAEQELRNFFIQMRKKYGPSNIDSKSTKANQLKNELHSFFRDFENRYSSKSRENPSIPEIQPERPKELPLYLEDLHNRRILRDFASVPEFVSLSKLEGYSKKSDKIVGNPDLYGPNDEKGKMLVSKNPSKNPLRKFMPYFSEDSDSATPVAVPSGDSDITYLGDVRTRELEPENRGELERKILGIARRRSHEIDFDRSVDAHTQYDNTSCQTYALLNGILNVQEGHSYVNDSNIHDLAREIKSKAGRGFVGLDKADVHIGSESGANIPLVYLPVDMVNSEHVTEKLFQDNTFLAYTSGILARTIIPKINPTRERFVTVLDSHKNSFFGKRREKFGDLSLDEYLDLFKRNSEVGQGDMQMRVYRVGYLPDDDPATAVHVGR